MQHITKRIVEKIRMKVMIRSRKAIPLIVVLGMNFALFYNFNKNFAGNYMANVKPSYLPTPTLSTPNTTRTNKNVDRIKPFNNKNGLI